METSVFQKVKAKARKVKDTIKTKTGHGPDIDNTIQNDQGQEDEQMVVDSEVHDAVPKYESPAVTSTAAGQKKPDDKLAKPATAAEDQYGSKYTDAQTRPSSQWPDDNTSNPGVNTARPTGMGAAGVQKPENRDGSFPSSGTLGTPGSESAGNFVHGEGGHMGDPRISTETPAAMEEDPYTPDHKSKVADPTGAVGEEAGIGSILNSFNKLNVDDGEPESKPVSERAPETYTDSQDHFSQEPILPTSTINPDDPGSIPKSFDGDKPEDAPRDNVTKLPSNRSSYTEKIPYADKGIAAKNAVVSKLGYGSTEDPTASPKATQGGEEIGKPGTPNQSNYTEKIPYADKGIAAKNAVASKLGYGSTEDPTESPKATQGGEEIGKPGTTPNQSSYTEKIPYADKGIAAKNVVASKLGYGSTEDPTESPKIGKPGTTPNQSSYTEKIPYADKGIAAKNVVASKLGYGSTEDPTESPKATQGGEEIGKPGTTPNQSSYIEKIPYADKAIAAKNVVASKLGYGSTEDPTASPKATQGGEEIGKPGTTTVYEKVFNAGSSVVTPAYGKVSSVGSSVVSKARGTGTKQDQGVEGQDQGVPVKKGYLVEKLRPSHDDKALSEVISEPLHNRKQEVDGEEGENQKPGLRERLGSDDGNRGITETESKADPNVSPTGKGMVESVKGTVASWFSMGGDQKQNSEASPGTIPEEERLSSSTGEEAVGHGQSGVGEGRL